MRKSTVALISTIFFLLGIIIGFLISPVKNGFGNNSGNNIENKNYYNNKEGDRRKFCVKMNKNFLSDKN